jgi:predicted nucleotidyltransferase
MMISKNQISELADNISKKFNTKKIIVFGSYAYGKQNSNSDLDLCIVTNLGTKRKIDLLRDIRREITLSVQYPIDVLLYDVKEFTERAIHQNTLEYEIEKHGLLING